MKLDDDDNTPYPIKTLTSLPFIALVYWIWDDVIPWGFWDF